MKFWLPITLLFVAISVFVAAKTITPNRSTGGNVACSTGNLSGLWTEPQLAYYNGMPVNETSYLSDSSSNNNQNEAILGVADPNDKWIEVDLSEQKIRAWSGSQLYLESLISSGLPGTPTPKGEFRIWAKLRYVKMEGGEGRYYYNLPNVPFTMFFESESTPKYLGYGLHGTYWHSDFGKVHSHGCVNLPTSVAGQIYEWANPVLPQGKKSVFASADNPGTRVVIHE